MVFPVILLNALRNSRASTVIDVGTVCPYMTAGIFPVPRSLPATLLPPPCRDSTFSLFASILRNSFVYKIHGTWDGRIRTCDCRIQIPEAYHLPPSQCNFRTATAKCRGAPWPRM